MFLFKTKSTYVKLPKRYRGLPTSLQYRRRNILKKDIMKLPLFLKSNDWTDYTYL